MDPIDNLLSKATELFSANDATEVDIEESEYLQEKEEIEESIIDTKDIDNLLNAKVSYNTRSVQIDSILGSLMDGYYVIPQFQRRYVWNKDKIAYLALSIIKNIPIPPLYLYLDPDTKQQYVLDGQQRLISLFLYFNDLSYSRSNNSIDFRKVANLNKQIKELEKERDLLIENKVLNGELKKIKDEIKEKSTILEKGYGMKRCLYLVEVTDSNTNEKASLDISFFNFEKKSQALMFHKTLEISLVECHDLYPQKTYAYIFKLLNSAGKLLSKQEIRNGVYWKTNLYDRLYNMNMNNSMWRSIYGKISIYSKDMEILLKGLSLAHFSKVSIDKDGEEIIEIEYPGFSWAKIIERYSELGLSSDLNQEIDLLDKYLNNIVFDTEESQKMKCTKAVFEACFVGYSLLQPLTDKKINYSWLCSVGDEFGTILSSKSNVESRLLIAYRNVREYFDEE